MESEEQIQARLDRAEGEMNNLLRKLAEIGEREQQEQPLGYEGENKSGFCLFQNPTLHDKGQPGVATLN